MRSTDMGEDAVTFHIASGATSTVMAAKHVETGERVAIKVLHFDPEDKVEAHETSEAETYRYLESTASRFLQ